MSENDIGKKMLARRKALGLSLEDVGKAVGVGKSTVRKWENGMIKNMGRDKIAALAAVLHMNPVEFVPAPTDKMSTPYITIKGDTKTLADTLVKATIKEPLKVFEYTPKAAQPIVKQLDQQTKSMMKLWEVSTPEAKIAAIGVLKSLNKVNKKENKP